MRYVTAGQDLTLLIQFKVGDQLVVPDDGTVTATIRDQSGNIVAGWNVKSITPVTLNQMGLSIPGAVNVASVREKRSVIIQFKFEGADYTQTIHYFVTPWLNLTVTPDDVRNFFGVELHELPDQFISIEDAYYRATSSYDKSVVDAALIDPEKMFAANDLILGFAGLDLVNVLRVRLMQSEESDQEKYSRFAKTDLSAFIGPLTDKISSAIAILIPPAVETTVTFFDTVRQTDPTTGA